MTRFFDLFVRARHWQIFLVLAGLPASLIFVFPFESGWAPAHFFQIAALSWVPTFCWFWALVRFLNSWIATADRPNLRVFRLTLALPLTYAVLIDPCAISTMGVRLGLLVGILHLTCMACMLYNLGFVAKSMTVAEGRTANSFYDWAGPFFLLWFFPIGIWFIQPRVNAMFRKMSALNEDRRG